jgi:hypothetical protein
MNLIIFNFRNIEIVDIYQKGVNGLIHYLYISITSQADTILNKEGY